MSIVPLVSDLYNQVSKLLPVWSGVTGGAVVFGLTQGATSYRERRAEGKRKRNIRKMLEIEIEHNLRWASRARNEMVEKLEEA